MGEGENHGSGKCTTLRAHVEARTLLALANMKERKNAEKMKNIMRSTDEQSDFTPE